MVNKEWLIKIKGQDNIWYDSEERVYRRRMFCPYCGQKSGCLCYEDLDMSENDEDEGMDYTCSSKCALLYGEWDNIDLVMSITDMKRDIIKLTDDEVKQVLNKFERKDILEAMQNCLIFKSIKSLNRDDINKILKHYSADVDSIIEELGLDIGKSVEDLTEEESKKVLDVLTEDLNYDGDYPSGDVCRT